MLRVLYACALREVCAAYTTKGSEHERCASMCVHRRNHLRFKEPSAVQTVDKIEPLVSSKGLSKNSQLLFVVVGPRYLDPLATLGSVVPSPQPSPLLLPRSDCYPRYPGEIRFTVCRDPFPRQQITLVNVVIIHWSSLAVSYCHSRCW